MKRIFRISAAVILLLLAGLYASLFYFSTTEIKANIRTATSMYGGTPEDALIAYLLDDKNPMQERTHLAVWTLGMIRSEKALPLLRELYRNDPDGETCVGKHDSVLCQYEIHKALKTIEKGSLLPLGHLK